MKILKVAVVIIAINFGPSNFVWGQANTEQEVSNSGQVINNGTAKLNVHLRALLDTSRKQTQRTLQSNAFVRIKQDQVQVYVQAKDSIDPIRQQLIDAGLIVELENDDLNIIQGWIDPSGLQVIAAMEGVKKITTPDYGYSRSGSVNTQGDAILRSNVLRNFGLNGQGVKVGIISDGSNNWTSARASGDLPSNITRYGSCTTRSADPENCLGALTCNEGTAMAEIIHDLAPAADIAIAAVSTSLEFINQVNQLANVFGADVIVDDLGFYAEPYFQDGPIAQAVAAVSSSVLFVSAAGNSADIHYERSYVNSTGSLHNFGIAEGGGFNQSNLVRVPARGFVVPILQWNDPFDGSLNDYNLFLYNEGLTQILAASTENQLEGNPPLEGFCYYNSAFSPRDLHLVIQKAAGSDKRLEMFTLGASALQYRQSSGSIFGHPAVSSAIAVAAINADEPGNNNIAFYSSRGPSRIDFPVLSNRQKPDITAIDGVSVTGAGGFPSTFFGTSAAAPHVAGIAAQLLSLAGSPSISAVKNALLNSGLDLGATGFDSTYGFGRIDAESARQALTGNGSPMNLTPWMLLLLGD